MTRCVYCGKPVTGAHLACPDHVHLVQKASQPRPTQSWVPLRAAVKEHSSPSLGRRGGRGR